MPESILEVVLKGVPERHHLPSRASAPNVSSEPPASAAPAPPRSVRRPGRPPPTSLWPGRTWRICQISRKFGGCHSAHQPSQWPVPEQVRGGYGHLPHRSRGVNIEPADASFAVNAAEQPAPPDLHMDRPSGGARATPPRGRCAPCPVVVGRPAGSRLAQGRRATHGWQAGSRDMTASAMPPPARLLTATYTRVQHRLLDRLGSPARREKHRGQPDGRGPVRVSGMAERLAHGNDRQEPVSIARAHGRQGLATPDRNPSECRRGRMALRASRGRDSP
jgi:hypothetical protein